MMSSSSISLLSVPCLLVAARMNLGFREVRPGNDKDDGRAVSFPIRGEDRACFGVFQGSGLVNVA